MDYAGLTRLLIRIAGVFSIAFTIGDMPTALERIYDSNIDAPAFLIAGAAGSIVAPLLIGVLLFVLAGPITNRTFDEAVPSNARPELGGVEGAALFVLGCYLLVYAVVDAAYLFAKLRLYFDVVETGLRYPPRTMSPADFAQMCKTIVKFTLALGLILFSRGIVALKDRLLALRGPLHQSGSNSG